MDRPGFDELAAFTAIADHRSFRKAADELGLAASTLSHMMRALETRMGLRLLHRTTRSVAPTEAGERLLTRLRPAMNALDEALAEATDLAEHPRGLLRLNAGKSAARVLMERVIPTFRARWPEVRIDLVVEEGLVDIVADGFDAGIRLGEAVPLDMIAVPFGGEARFVAVAAAAYLRGRETPKTPDDLKTHDCVRFRLSTGRIYRWEFEKQGQTVAVDLDGPLIVNDLDLVLAAVDAGLGIGFLPDRMIAAGAAAGRLVTVLDDWSPPFPGLALYYSGHRRVPAALRAFVDVLKEVGSMRPGLEPPPPSLSVGHPRPRRD